jgi:hypothetical protein
MDNPEMTKDHAIAFFAEFYLGVHHIPARGCCGSHGVKEFGTGWSVNHYGDLSSFDFDSLTRLVFLAHDRCVRVEVMNSGPRRVKIAIWKRAGREGEIWARHPTLEQAIELWRKRHALENVA